jgi:hypothetical protein
LTYLGFITKGKLAAIFIKPSLGVSNWPVIYFINYTPTSSLALFNTAPPERHGWWRRKKKWDRVEPSPPTTNI